MQDILLRLDSELAKFFDFLDQRVGLTNVVMVLTGDHGVTPPPTFAQTQGFAGERVDSSVLYNDLTNRLNLKFGSAKYLLSPRFYDGNLCFDHQVMSVNGVTDRQMVDFIRDWALNTGKFETVFSREQLLDGRAPGLIGRLVINGYNPERSGDIVLILKPFAVPVGRSDATTHGSPYTYDTHVPVLFFGAPFMPGRYADEFNITDLVPTLAAALRINEPPGCMGKPFVKALANP